MRQINQKTQCEDLFWAFYRSYRCFELENISFRRVQSGVEKVNTREAWWDDQETLEPWHATERVLEARQDDTSITRKYPRVSEKEIEGRKETERAVPLRRLQNFTPSTDLAAIQFQCGQLTPLWGALWGPADHLIRGCREGEGGGSHP